MNSNNVKNIYKTINLNNDKIVNQKLLSAVYVDNYTLIKRMRELVRDYNLPKYKDMVENIYIYDINTYKSKQLLNQINNSMIVNKSKEIGTSIVKDIICTESKRWR